MPYLEILLLIYVLIREILAYKERREMLDRLMSKDLTDFKTNTQEEDNQVLQDEDDGTISILEARDEMLNG